jgi:hypothetical protein
MRQIEKFRCHYLDVQVSRTSLMNRPISSPFSFRNISLSLLSLIAFLNFNFSAGVRSGKYCSKLSMARSYAESTTAEVGLEPELVMFCTPFLILPQTSANMADILDPPPADTAGARALGLMAFFSPATGSICLYVSDCVSECE